MNKFVTLFSLVILLSIIPIFPGISHISQARAMEKPRVAVLQPTVSDKISNSSRKHLNLEKLQAEMEASFLATRKFDVVTRNKSSLQVIRDEQKFAESDLAAGDAAESGALQNADYLINSKVHVFGFYTVTKKVPNLQSKYFRTDHGVLEINAQVLDTKTGKVTTTFNLKSSFSTKQRMVNSKNGTPSPEQFTKLAKNVSGQMADQFLDLVFPVMIIKVSGNKVYLNRGKDGGFKKDMLLNVYSPGESLIDPYTGEDLGSAEEYVGQIKVDRINPKMTTATFNPGKMEGDVGTGYIVRKP